MALKSSSVEVELSVTPVSSVALLAVVGALTSGVGLAGVVDKGTVVETATFFCTHAVSENKAQRAIGANNFLDFMIFPFIRYRFVG